MQTLGNLNTASSNTVTFVATANLVLQEFDQTYRAHAPTWETIRKLGNLSGTGLTVTQNFSFTGNLSGNISLSAANVGNATYSIVGNVVTINNIRTVEDYLGSSALVTLVDEATGNIVHVGNVYNTNSGQAFVYETTVEVIDGPEFTKSVLGNIEYDFFGSNVSNLSNIVTSIASSAPRLRTLNQPTTGTVTISIQDGNNSIYLGTSGSSTVTKTYSNVGNTSLSIAGNVANINEHLGTLSMTKVGYANIALSGNLVSSGNVAISNAQSKFGGYSLAVSTANANAYVSGTSTSFSTGDFTIECWVRWTGSLNNSSVTAFIGVGDAWLSGSFAMGVLRQTGGSSLYMATPSQSTAIFNATYPFQGLASDTWYHVAMVRSGTTVTGYINGTVCSTTLTSSVASNNPTRTMVGGMTSNNFVGWVDEARVSSTARYSGAFTPAGSPFTTDGSTAFLAHLDDLVYQNQINDINRQARQITYAYTNPANVVTQVLTGNYWAAFEDPIHAVGNVTGMNTSYGPVYGRGQYSYPVRISFVGTHAVTGEPHFAIPMMNSAGNAIVKIVGQRLTSGSIVAGPTYDLGYTGGNITSGMVAMPTQAISTFDNTSNVGTTGSNTVQLRISNVSIGNGYQSTVGCDVGDIRYGNTQISGANYYMFGNGSVKLSTGNVYGTGDTHYARYYTPSAGNVTYTGTDWYDQYTLFPAQWGINQLAAGDNYDIVVKGRAVTGSSGDPIWPEARLYYGRPYSYYSVPAGSVVGESTGTQLMTLNGQYGTLHNVVLTPGVAGGAIGKSITLWRGLTILDNTEYQHVVSINAVGHSMAAGNIGTVVRDHLCTANTAGTGISHTITTTTAGGSPVSLKCTNTQIPGLTGVSLSEDYTPELFLRRGQSYTFTVSSTTYPVVITDTYNGGNIGNTLGIANNNISTGNITFTPTASTPDHMYYRSTGGMTYNRGHIWIYDGDPAANNARWGTIVPGAVALVRGGSDFAYMIYTKYTGSRTAGRGSAGLYYRKITVNSDYSLTWGTAVLVQDPAATGNIYGTNMAASSTTINGVTYVLCSIMPDAPSSLPATTTVVGIRIVN